jgi:hypothetical protein
LKTSNRVSLLMIALAAMFACVASASAARIPTQKEKVALRQAAKRDTGVQTIFIEAHISTVNPVWAYVVEAAGTATRKARSDAVFEKKNGMWEIVIEDPRCGSINKVGVPVKVRADLGLSICKVRVARRKPWTKLAARRLGNGTAFSRSR